MVSEEESGISRGGGKGRGQSRHTLRGGPYMSFVQCLCAGHLETCDGLTRRGEGCLLACVIFCERVG